MPRKLFSSILLDAVSALNAAAKLGWQMLGSENTTVYVVFGPGTTAGTVVIEEAHDQNYTGTWANIATVAWAAADRCHAVNISGNHMAIRVRVSVAIVGGNVSAYANVTG